VVLGEIRAACMALLKPQKYGLESPRYMSDAKESAPNRTAADEAFGRMAAIEREMEISLLQQVLEGHYATSGW